MKLLKRLKTRLQTKRATGWINDKLDEVKVNIQSIEVADINKVSDSDINFIRSQIKEIQDFIGNKDSLSIDYTDIITKLNDLTIKVNELDEKLKETVNFQFFGKVAGGTITEGEWTPIQWEQQKNSFIDMTYTSPSFTLTQPLDFLEVSLTGQTDNTGTSKIIQIRLVDSSGTVIGNVQQLSVTTSNRVAYDTVIESLPAGTYTVQINSTAAGGSITFTNGNIKIERNGGGADLLGKKVNGLGVDNEVITLDETVFIPVDGKITIDPEQLGGNTDKIDLADPLTEAPSGTELTQQDVNRVVKDMYLQLEID